MTPAMPRLPMQDRPNSLGSSARKSITSIACRSTTPDSASERAISSAASTPAGPSKRPPDGTVSECEPIRMVPAAAIRSGAAADQIAGRIDAGFKSGCFEALAQPDATLVE